MNNKSDETKQDKKAQGKEPNPMKGKSRGKRSNGSNRSGKQGQQRQLKPKEAEVNIEEQSINQADLPAKGNDYTWYTHYPVLFKNVSGINFGVPVGSAIDVGTEGNFLVAQRRAFGVCDIHFVPTMGSTGQDFANVANKVSAQLYSVMRIKLGSKADYEPNDIAIYMGAMDSAFMIYALGVKIYGLLNYSSPFNDYYMINLGKSFNFDLQSFRDNMSNFRSMINSLAVYLSARMIPASFDVFKRHLWMIQNLFTDANSAKSQVYSFTPDGFYVYTEVTEGPAYLKYTPLTVNPGDALTFELWSNAQWAILNAVLGSTDIDQMSADIQKAFEGDTYLLSMIPESYMTPISYSEEVLAQIENLLLVGNVDNTYSYKVDDATYGSMDIIQQMRLPLYTNPQLYQAAITNPAVKNITGDLTAVRGQSIIDGYRGKKLINVHVPEVSDELVMVATRGVVVTSGSFASQTDKTRAQLMITNYGTEIFTTAYLRGINSAGTDFVTYRYSYVTYDERQQDTIQVLQAWSQFDWAPVINVNVGLVTADDCFYARMQDLDMYAIIDDVQVAALNNCAVLSEFYSDKFPQVVQ